MKTPQIQYAKTLANIKADLQALAPYLENPKLSWKKLVDLKRLLFPVPCLGPPVFDFCSPQRLGS